MKKTLTLLPAILRFAWLGCGGGGDNKEGSQTTSYPGLTQNVNHTTRSAWAHDGVQSDLRSGGNSPNSPSDRDGITSAFHYRTENMRSSPTSASVAGGEMLVPNNAGFIATPVYTFILPDLTRYPGNISTATTLYHA